MSEKGRKGASDDDLLSTGVRVEGKKLLTPREVDVYEERFGFTLKDGNRHLTRIDTWWSYKQGRGRRH